MLHSLADYGACFSWTVPISGAALAIHRLRFGTGPASAAPTTCQTCQSRWDASRMPRMAPRISDLLGPVFYCGTAYIQRTKLLSQAHCSMVPVQQKIPVRGRGTSCPAGTNAQRLGNRQKKVSMASINRSCGPPARAVPCGGLYRAQPLGDLDDPGRPSLRGDPIADGSFREASSMPASRPFSRMTAPTLTARRYPASNTRDGAGSGVAWHSVAGA